MRALEGRADDVIELPGASGAPVPIHPLHFAVVTRDRGVREFQVRQEGDAIRLLVVPSADAGAGLEARLRDAVAGRLAAAGCTTRA